MIYRAILIANDDDSVLLNINGIEINCFSNQGIIANINDELLVELEVYDDFQLKESLSAKKMIMHESGYSYVITGILDIDKGGIDSLIFFEIDELYEYSYLDKKMVELHIIRIDCNKYSLCRLGKSQ